MRRLLRRWYWILAGGLAGAALAAAYSLTLPNQYSALARVVLEPRGITPIRDTVAPQGLNSEATIAYSQSQVDIIRSTSVLVPVIRNEGLADDPEFADAKPWLDRLGLSSLQDAVFGDEGGEPSTLDIVDELQKRLYVGRLNQTFVIEIGFTAETPTKAARIANAITRQYLRSESGAQSAAAESANENLTSRLESLRDKVAASEAAIEAHKRRFNLVESNGRLVDDESLSRLNEQLDRATAQTSEARSLVELAERIDVDDVVGGGLPPALATPTLLQSRLQYQRSQAQFRRLNVKLGDRHPQLLEAKASVEAAEDSIREELRRVTAANGRELERAESREADLRKQVAELRAAALAANAPKAQLRELERQLDADRRVYEAFLQRSRETGEQTKIATRNARVITEALPPEEKSGPLRRLMTVTGGVMGAGLAGFLLLLPLGWRATRILADDEPAAPPPETRSATPPVADDLYGAPVGPRLEVTPTDLAAMQSASDAGERAKRERREEANRKRRETMERKRREEADKARAAEEQRRALAAREKAAEEAAREAAERARREAAAREERAKVERAEAERKAALEAERKAALEAERMAVADERDRIIREAEERAARIERTARERLEALAAEQGARLEEAARAEQAALEAARAAQAAAENADRERREREEALRREWSERAAAADDAAQRKAEEATRIATEAARAAEAALAAARGAAPAYPPAMPHPYGYPMPYPAPGDPRWHERQHAAQGDEVPRAAPRPRETDWPRWGRE